MRMRGKKKKGKTEHLEKIKQRNRERKADKRREASPSLELLLPGHVKLWH